jgi:hypothetical protein
MIKKFENFVNESQMKVKRSEEEITNVLKRIARGQFYKYLSDSTLSIKKHNDNKFDRSELKSYLREIGLEEDERYYEALSDRLSGSRSPYTFEEFKKISEILFNALKRKSIVYVFSILKVLFEPIDANDFKRDYEDKLDALRRVRITYKVKDIPIVIGINGKPLTGEVYYNEFLDIYTETEDEMREGIDKFISSAFYKGIEMIDDYNIDNFSQVKNYSKVNLGEYEDLDKKTKWGTKEHDWRKSIEN